MADEGFTAEELVQVCNKILVYAGLIARVANAEEVRVVCSSTGLFVAALEGFLQQRLDDVIRAPSTPAERAYNNDTVVDVLSQILSTDLSHISGERVVEGSLEDISNLLELLAALCHGRPLQGPPGEPGTGALTDPEEEGDLPEDHEDDHSSAGGDSQGDDPADDEGTGEEGEASEGSEAVTEGLQAEQHAEEDDEAQPEDFDEQEEEEEGDDEEDPQGLERHDAGQWEAPVQRPVGAVRWPPPYSRAPLSPIRELSREDGESMYSARDTPAEASGAQPAARSRAAPPAAGPGPQRGSSGGASSVISIPSNVDGASHRGTEPGGRGRQPPSVPPPPLRPAWPEQLPQAPEADESLSAASGSTTTLLERALTEAEATLRELGHEYEDFYYHDEEEQGHRRAVKPQRRVRSKARATSSTDGAVSRSSGAQVHKAAQRDLRAAPWPDGETGTLKQHKAFLRSAKRVLTGDASAKGAAAVPSRLLVGYKSKPGATAAGGSGGDSVSRDGSAKSVVTGSKKARRPKNQSARTEGAYKTLLQAVRGDIVPYHDPAKDGRKLLQRTGPAQGSELPLGPPGRDRLHARDAAVPAQRDTTKSVAKEGVSLSADLESKLRYVFRLASENPKQRAASEAVQHVEVTEELLRHAQRKQLVDRLSSARARRQEALRLTAERLQERGQEYDKRVEQLRLQRLAAEWNAKQRSAQMRRALQAELTLREAFLEVLRGEKEVLLVERQEAKATARFPKYQTAMRKAEQEYLELFHSLEALLAAERQQRARATQEALQAQRQENQLAAALVQERLQELLGRIAREEEATMQRHSVATRPQSRQELVGQIRRLLGL